jgi:hypothetical protein
MRIILGLLFVVLVVQLFRLIVESAGALAALNWPATNGTVEASSVQEVHWHRGGPGYLPTVSYTYEVDGKPFTSSRIWVHEFDGSLEWAQRTAARFPVGATVKVYYDAEDAELSLLLPEIPWNLFGYVALFGFIALVVGYLAFGNGSNRTDAPGDA